MITILSTSPKDPDYVQAERGHQTGKVPSSYIEILES